MGIDERFVGSVGALLGGTSDFPGLNQSGLHVGSHRFQGLFMRLHRPLLEYRDVAEHGGGYEEKKSTYSFQNRDTVLVILTLCFVPVLGLWIKLINDGHTRLGLFVIGFYLLLVGWIIFLPWL